MKFSSDRLSQLAYHSSILWKNRKAIPRVASGYFNRLVLQKPVLRTVEFAVTPFCNVNCQMCYATKLVDKSKELMKPDDYAAIWKQATRLGAFSAHISGGEPTLRRDLTEIIAAFEPGKNIVSMTTNATRLDSSYLQRLRQAGLSVLHFSLNNLDPEVNDSERDFKGHSSTVMNAIDDAKKLGFDVCLSIVVAHGKLKEMRELSQLAKQKNIGIVFSLATPSGNWAGACDQMLTPDEWLEVDLFMQKSPHVRSDWMINLSMKKECPAGYEKVSISPYGEVQGCAMSFVSHGNVLSDPLEAIWSDMRQFEPYRKRSPVCLIGLDHEFVNAYLLPANSMPVLPVRADKLPPDK